MMITRINERARESKKKTGDKTQDENAKPKTVRVSSAARLPSSWPVNTPLASRGTQKNRIHGLRKELQKRRRAGGVHGAVAVAATL